MEKQKFLKFKVGVDYDLYIDINDSNKIFALKIDQAKIVEKTLHDFRNNRKHIPNKLVVKVLKVDNIGEKDQDSDFYDIVDYLEIDYPINRLYSPGTKLIDSSI